MRAHDSQGTSFKENIQMVMVEILNFPHGRISHKLLNVGVEAVRAHCKITVFLIIGLVAALVACLL